MEIMLFHTFNKGTVKGAKDFRVEIENGGKGTQGGNKSTCVWSAK